MSRYDYKVALTVLSEQDKNRLLACYFSMENPNTTVGILLHHSTRNNQRTDFNRLTGTMRPPLSEPLLLIR